jgi:Flp pilus assembly protein TadG
MIRDPRLNMRRRGAAVVETALVLAVFVLLLFGIYEYARLLFMKQLLDNAAREGARLAVVHTSDLTTTDIQSEVTTSMVNMQSHLQNVQINVFLADGNGNNIGKWTDARFGQYIAVQISGDYKPVLPSLLFMKSTIHLQGKAMMYAESD